METGLNKACFKNTPSLALGVVCAPHLRDMAYVCVWNVPLLNTKEPQFWKYLWEITKL